MYVLEAANGPLDGKRWPFEASVEIGRDAALVVAALPLDAAVSRRHARVEIARDRVVLHDLQSSNGTIVRGDAITGQCELALGELFTVGRTQLRVLDDGRSG